MMQQFMQHVADYGLSYGTIEEFHFRHDIFMKLHEQMDELNNTQGMTSTVGHNFMSTWTAAEKKKLTGHIATDDASFDAEVEYLQATNSNMSPIDWTTQGVVNAV